MRQEKNGIYRTKLCPRPHMMPFNDVHFTAQNLDHEDLFRGHEKILGVCPCTNG